MVQSKNQGKLVGKENQIINEYVEQKLSATGIAKIHGVHENSILKLLKKHNIPIRPRKITPKDMKERCIERYKAGASLEAAGAPDGLSAAAVLMYMAEYRVPTRGAEEAHRKYPINENFFDNIDTEEKAYFLGFLYADGCNQIAHHYSVVLALDSIDKEILHKLSNLIYKNPIDANNQVKIQNREHEGKGIEVILNINSKHICLQMLKLGCVSRKTFLLDYPKWMRQDLHRHFIRGYFDGDGSINNETLPMSGCKIVSTKQFLEGIQKVSKITAKLYKDDDTNDKNTYILTYCGNRNIQKFLNWIYAGSKIHLQRKYEAYLRFCEKMHVIDEKMLAGTQGYSKSVLDKNYPDFYAPLNINGTILDKKTMTKMSKNDKEYIANDIFHYMRSTGFNFTFNENILNGFDKLCKYDIKKENPLNSGARLCTNICKLYCQDFYKTSFKDNISIYTAFHDDELLMKCIMNRLGLIWKTDEIFSISYSTIIQGFISSMITYNISNFKPSIAKYIYEKYTEKDDVIYDYSAGWGGRMLGAASCGRKYIGVDPLTIPSLYKIKNDLNLQNITLIQDGSENIKLENNSIDFSFSSPPYYDLEKYSSDDNQAYNNGEIYFYENYWNNTLKNIKNMLKPDKLFSINISNLPKMLTMAKNYFDDPIEQIEFSMPRMHTNRTNNETKKYEYIYIFRNIK